LLVTRTNTVSRLHLRDKLQTAVLTLGVCHGIVRLRSYQRHVGCRAWLSQGKAGAADKNFFTLPFDLLAVIALLVEGDGG
jgi:hypothetical protein